MNRSCRKVLIVGDNQYLMRGIFGILSKQPSILCKQIEFTFACSSAKFFESPVPFSIHVVDVRKEWERLSNSFDLIISAHCKQVFPEQLTKSVRCINIHPGFNPYNRGWFPHVFSIINKLEAGATIHEMDKNIDHGPIITQRIVEIASHDTSETLYDRILGVELEIFSETIEKILEGNYATYLPHQEGNLNRKQDFQRLTQIDLDRLYSGREMIDLLRALTHGNHKNAYFVDDAQKKVFVRLSLEPEEG